MEKSKCHVAGVKPFTGQNSHRAMDGIGVPTGQRLHQNLEQFWPNFGPVPVCNG